jgi:hypothetical protein
VHEDESLLGVIRNRLTSIHSEEECRTYADAILESKSKDKDTGKLNILTRLLLFLRHLPPDQEGFILEMLFKSRRTSRLHFQIAAKVPYFNTRPDEALQSRLNTWVLREIEGMEECLLAQDAFKDKDAQFSNIFKDETARLLQARQEAVLSMIQYLYADLQIGVAVGGLKSSSTRLQASAIETIENILPRKTAELLIPFIEGNIDKAYEQSKQQHPAFDLERVFGEWVNSDIAWLSCLALYLAAQCRFKGLWGIIEKKETDNPLENELRASYLEKVSSNQ